MPGLINPSQQVFLMRPVCGCKHKYGGLIYQLQLLLGAQRERRERGKEILGECLGYDGMKIFNFQLLTNLLFQSAAAALCQNDQFSQTKSSHLVLFVCLFVCLFERVFFFV